MQLNLAQVLNTIAHEIRTPLAVSQGYLKLYLDGRLTNADDQQRAFQQTRAALGTLATLATDMGKVSVLSEAPSPALMERVPAPQLVDLLKRSEDVEGAEWAGDVTAPVSVASNGSSDLARAVAIVAKAAFDEARDQKHVVHVSGGEELTMLAGTPEAIPALEAGPDAAAAHGRIRITVRPWASGFHWCKHEQRISRHRRRRQAICRLHAVVAAVTWLRHHHL
jgi:hypothetical protein